MLSSGKRHHVPDVARKSRRLEALYQFMLEKY